MSERYCDLLKDSYVNSKAFPLLRRDLLPGASRRKPPAIMSARLSICSALYCAAWPPSRSDPSDFFAREDTLRAGPRPRLSRYHAPSDVTVVPGKQPPVWYPPHRQIRNAVLINLSDCDVRESLCVFREASCVRGVSDEVVERDDRDEKRQYCAHCHCFICPRCHGKRVYQ